MNGQYLTPAEVSERYGGKVSTRTLANWRSDKSGSGPEFIRIGGRILYAVDKIAEWERRNTYMSTSEYKSASR